MFYQVLIETNEKVGKSQKNKELYELDKVNLEEIESEIVTPFLEKEKFQFNGYFLDPLNILRLVIKETEKSVKDYARLENANRHPNGFFITSPQSIVHQEKYTIDITKKVFENAKFKISNQTCKTVTTNLIKNLNTNKVFIGHGGSHAWRDLKDFINTRLELEYDEFNRVPVAGLTNVNRLSQMLDNACFAFLVMTAEDEKADGNLQARQNVIHEVGLFQGKLGFEKAIVLLEEGCEEFSNIHGLGQIRFPKGNIGAKFEAIREVLERENILIK